MKIIGTKKEIEFFREVIKQFEYVECFECPFEDKCNELQESDIDSIVCSDIIWSFVDVEEEWIN